MLSRVLMRRDVGRQPVLAGPERGGALLGEAGGSVPMRPGIRAGDTH